MRALPLLAIMLLVAPGVTSAACYGSASYKTCTDDQGNSYSVQKSGNQTRVQGYNYQTGSSWSQSTQRIGNSSYTTGYDADGNSWNSNSRTIGNTTYQSGTDSDGNYFNNTIRRSGSSTNYSGYDSNGNSHNKTCTAYGCY